MAEKEKWEKQMIKWKTQLQDGFFYVDFSMISPWFQEKLHGFKKKGNKLLYA